jgi:hypothetical protein
MPDRVGIGFANHLPIYHADNFADGNNFADGILHFQFTFSGGDSGVYISTPGDAVRIS